MNVETPPIRVLLADDHAVVRAGIRQVLEHASDMLIVAEAGDGEAAQILIRQHLPDVAVLDIQMPKASGILKTENIGIEKIIANVNSNPFIRYLILCGEDIRGHRSGASLVALHKNGLDQNHRIIDAPGAIPYIENLNQQAIKRFQDQITIINLIGVTQKDYIDTVITDCDQKAPPSFGAPYIAIRIKSQASVTLTDNRALHSRIIIDYLVNIKKRGM